MTKRAVIATYLSNAAKARVIASDGSCLTADCQARFKAIARARIAAARAFREC